MKKFSDVLNEAWADPEFRKEFEKDRKKMNKILKKREKKRKDELSLPACYVCHRKTKSFVRINDLFLCKKCKNEFEIWKKSKKCLIWFKIWRGDIRDEHTGN